MENHFATQPHIEAIECWYWIRKLQARFLAGEYAAALEASHRAQGLLTKSPGMLERAEHELYSALTHAALCDPDRATKAASTGGDGAHHRQLDVWARHCPENFENRPLLVAAEIARIEGRDPDAMRLYEQAIRSARDNGFVNNEALALEIAARFYAGRGLRPDRQDLPARRSGRLPAVGRRWKGPAARDAVSLSQPTSIRRPIRRAR